LIAACSSLTTAHKIKKWITLIDGLDHVFLYCDLLGRQIQAAASGYAVRYGAGAGSQKQQKRKAPTSRARHLGPGPAKRGRRAAKPGYKRGDGRSPDTSKQFPKPKTGRSPDTSKQFSKPPKKQQQRGKQQPPGDNDSDDADEGEGDSADDADLDPDQFALRFAKAVGLPSLDNDSLQRAIAQFKRVNVAPATGVAASKREALNPEQLAGERKRRAAAAEDERLADDLSGLGSAERAWMMRRGSHEVCTLCRRAVDSSTCHLRSPPPPSRSARLCYLPALDRH
jgi:hypothetical protein